jgi:hypothetical protein
MIPVEEVVWGAYPLLCLCLFTVLQKEQAWSAAHRGEARGVSTITCTMPFTAVTPEQQALLEENERKRNQTIAQEIMARSHSKAHQSASSSSSATSSRSPPIASAPLPIHAPVLSHRSQPTAFTQQFSSPPSAPSFFAPNGSAQNVMLQQLQQQQQQQQQQAMFMAQQQSLLQQPFSMRFPNMVPASSGLMPLSLPPLQPLMPLMPQPTALPPLPLLNGNSFAASPQTDLAAQMQNQHRSLQAYQQAQQLQLQQQQAAQQQQLQLQQQAMLQALAQSAPLQTSLPAPNSAPSSLLLPAHSTPLHSHSSLQQQVEAMQAQHAQQSAQIQAQNLQMQLQLLQQQQAHKQSLPQGAQRPATTAVTKGDTQQTTTSNTSSLVPPV